ncbi:MAG: alpha/beta hydrolase [Hyphomicrobiales bacterium]|nr:alpha/beta hydrolase [Hyphomicrobiales bacterium]
MASIGVKVIRSLFAAGEKVAPRLAGRVAFEMFCRTPNPKRLTDGERRAVDRALGFMDEARHHRLTVAGQCVAAHEFRPRGGRNNAGTVLVMHGWRSRTEYMKALIEAYRDAGFRVVSLDLPGHGASPGRRLTMVSAVRAASAAAQWFGPFAAVVGHSFGGAVAFNAVAGSVHGIAPVPASRLVLIAAPSSMPHLFRDFGRFLNLGPRTQSAVADQVRRISGRPLDDFIGSHLLAATPVPTLVIHAPDDREVAAAHAELFALAGDHVRVLWAPGLGHRRILSDPAIVAQSLDFVFYPDGTLH